MSRLPLLQRSDIPEEFQYVWDRQKPIGGGDVPNIFRAMSNNPKVWRAYLRMGNGLWSDCGLDTKTRELAILRTALLAHSAYEWHQHVRIGRAAGLKDEQILALHHWRDSDHFSPAERAMLGYIDAVAASDHPAADIHAALAAHYPPAALVGINLLVGYYSMTAKFLSAMEVETEEPFVGWELQGAG